MDEGRAKEATTREGKPIPLSGKTGTPKLHMARRLTERTTTVALANDLEALRATKPRTLEAWLELADTEDRDAVLEAIRDRTLLPNALSLVLRRNGIPVSRETIIQMREDKQ